jgi:hypothetical protein
MFTPHVGSFRHFDAAIASPPRSTCRHGGPAAAAAAAATKAKANNWNARAERQAAIMDCLALNDTVKIQLWAKYPEHEHESEAFLEEYGDLGYRARNEFWTRPDKARLIDQEALNLCYELAANLVLDGQMGSTHIADMIKVAWAIEMAARGRLRDDVGKNLAKILIHSDYDLIAFLKKQTRCHCLDALLRRTPETGRCTNYNMCGTEVSKAKLMLCSRCKVEQYCSKDCQRILWPHHKKVCKDLIGANN